jgi:hypothetical protein
MIKHQYKNETANEKEFIGKSEAKGKRIKR